MKRSLLKLSFYFFVFLVALQISPVSGQESNAVAYARQAVFLGIPPGNIVSVSKEVAAYTKDTLLVVPDDCSFMLTDLIATSVFATNNCHIHILSQAEPEEIEISVWGQDYDTPIVNMTSGIPFSPAAPVIAYNTWSDAQVTISGYYFGCTK